MTDKIIKSGDIAEIKSPKGFLQRVGDVLIARSGGTVFRRVGEVEKYSQECKSKSLRRDRVEIKRLVGLSA